MAKPVHAAPWSYSKAKAFDTCPKQFYHEQVLKEFPFTETDAIRYGNEFHKAAEKYIGDGDPLPGKFEQYKKVLDSLNNKPGEKLCEQKLGLTKDLQPCSFWDNAVWFRGVVDVIILDGDLAWIIDHKTGKSAKYADTGQLELMAVTVFAHYPQIKTIRAGLLFVVANALVKAKYERDDTTRLWAKWLKNYTRMEAAFSDNMWNPKPSGLCRAHCPVLKCLHNGRQ